MAVALAEIVAPIEELLERKRATSEVGVGDPVQALNDSVSVELQRHEGVLSGHDRPDLLEKRAVVNRLNDVFRECVGEAFES